ncbi:MAG: hypothetical protein HRT83_04260 [Hyphomicrobiaceae bacterium]|nr:hypothetical protein [Hyphomicrobiaceae bacterium]
MSKYVNPQLPEMENDQVTDILVSFFRLNVNGDLDRQGYYLFSGYG